MKRYRLFVVVVMLCALLMGCSKGSVATINGVFTGMHDEVVFVEEVMPGSTKILDSIKTNNKGKFSYKYSFVDDNPVFIRLRIEQDFITLLVSPKESITVESIVNLSKNYTVTGSEGSSLVREITQALLASNQKIDDNVLRYKSTTIESERSEIERDITRQSINLRKDCIEFLVKNSKSLASVMVLYQTYPNGQSIFGGKDDHLYFSHAADSLSVVYPTSPHVEYLVNSVGEYHKQAYRLANLINASHTLPEIKLPNIYGDEEKLSDLVGKKYVLLVFWSAADASSAFINKELKELYEKYKDKDFEIYQVSLDLDRNLWLNRVIETNLPWVNVRDGLGPARSVSARTYQVNTLPYNFFIGKDGVPTFKNLWGSQLEDKIKEVIK